MRTPEELQQIELPSTHPLHPKNKNKKNRENHEARKSSDNYEEENINNMTMKIKKNVLNNREKYK